MSDAADRQARRAALEPSASFIVQAPAGSGKTELLIQRYLRLLATVREPEQILAITFTRKAAAEMRTRVLAALQDAREPTADCPEHKVTTRELATAALRADAQLGWDLLADPNRIGIKTLDAFNTDLAMRLPLSSGGIAQTEVTDDADALYREAARRAVESIWQADVPGDGAQAVLQELDFSVPRAEQLVVSLLQVREQWIHWSFDVDGSVASTRQMFDELRAEASAAVERLVEPSLRGVLEGLTRHAYEHGDAAMRTLTADIVSDDPGRRWAAVAGLLLRRGGDWRKTVTKREGFPPQDAQQKKECLDVLESLQDNDRLNAALRNLLELPRSDLNAEEIRVLGAISQLLKLAVAELRVLFARRRVTDFTELSLTAQQALGEVDAPSDLLLALDRRLQHILVDEFQDTSLAQVQLLETLTEGWEPGDGRTLFLVGDPMQSIYRFRNADMSLFIGARQFGIGNVALIPLHLSANFRSEPAIVDWVNRAFGHCFPDQDDLQRGVAGFNASSAARESGGDDGVHCHALESDSLTDEHACVLETLSRERALSESSSVAILVRSRGHLAGFQALLRENGWRARAVEIDAPHTSALTQDLIGLARALTHFGDRLAWLAQLRAPWCGLTWDQLEILVGDDADATVWEILHDAAKLAQLDQDAQRLLSALRAALQHALERRGELPFVQWLYETWRSLGGPAALIQDHRVSELDAVLALFEQAAVDQDIADVAELESFFTRPVRQADSSAGGIEIMTIHRAKGLEFDCVILPGLARTPPAEQRRLLEWYDLIDEHGTRRRAVAPLRRDETASAAWIRRRARGQALAETARLMYVATTRARAWLHLVWGLGEDRSPPSTSLLAPLWSLLEATPVTRVDVRPVVAERIVLPLRRLRTALPIAAPAANPDPVDAAAVHGALGHDYPWNAGTAVQIGIVVHEWLQTICETDAESWDSARVGTIGSAVRRHLFLLGVLPAELEAATAQVLCALTGVLEDPRGRWIVGARELARSELMLSSVAGARVIHQRLDRTFVEGGCRWIIDYKTSSCSDGDVEAFLDSEVERYREQLEAYARAMAEFDDRPIRLGLYFPMLPAFRDWPAPGGTRSDQRAEDTC